MTHDFDTPVSREGTASLKYEGRETYFGTKDITPVWVADMDFAAPVAVTRALVGGVRSILFMATPNIRKVCSYQCRTGLKLATIGK